MLANYLTFLRILLVIPAMLFVKLDNMAGSLFIFFLASLTDYLDGMVARRFNQVTTMGKFLDPLADKIMYLSAVLLFLEKNYVHPIPIILILMREFFALGYGPIVILKDGDILVGKLKNLFQFSSILIVVIYKNSIISTVSIWLSVITTVLSGTILYLKHYKELNKTFKDLS